MKNLFRAAFLFLCAVLAGCASLPQSIQTVDSIAHQQQLEQLSHWKIKGRLAFKSPEEKFSAYLHWQQRDQTFDLQLNTFIGTTLVSMQGYPGFASLEANDKTFSDRNASELIKRVTGWNIPVESLALWVKGQHTQDDSVVYDEFGRVKSLTARCNGCAGWLLNFSNYRTVDDIPMPHQIELINQQDQSNQVKIKVTSWQKI